MGLYLELSLGRPRFGARLPLRNPRKWTRICAGESRHVLHAAVGSPNLSTYRRPRCIISESWNGVVRRSRWIVSVEWNALCRPCRARQRVLPLPKYDVALPLEELTTSHDSGNDGVRASNFCKSILSFGRASVN